MYVKKVSLINIRSIKKLVMEFPNPAGWHVIIGDNGSGKSTVVRSISYTLVGLNQNILRISTDQWLRKNCNEGKIELNLKAKNLQESWSHFSLSTNFGGVPPQYRGLISPSFLRDGTEEEILSENSINNKLFSAGFGPFRRFSGGDPDNDFLFKEYPLVGAHLSIFNENVALTESLNWLKTLDYERLIEKEKNNGKESTVTYQNLIRFINESNLLLHNTKIEGLDKDGIIFRDGNGTQIPILELSDGYRSILSLTFELIRQLVRVYGAQAVFADIEKGKMEINLPGVVLIDEIDAHLHPSWQVDVGFWFTKYFPQLQFIVTTHSPLVCRAAEKGSIWRLAKPGTDSQAEEITGVEKERLIYGNILDAYGTELFGENTVRSKKSNQKLDRLGRLNMLYAIGKIKPEEEKERLKLQKILSTDDPTGF